MSKLSRKWTSRLRLVLAPPQLRYLLAGVLLTVGLAVAWFLLRDPITSANYERIEQGMTEAEVDQLLGRPADWEYWLMLDGPTDKWWRSVKADGTTVFGEAEKGWNGHYHTILVSFDAEGKVCGKSFMDANKAGEPWTQTLRKLLGLK